MGTEMCKIVGKIDITSLPKADSNKAVIVTNNQAFADYIKSEAPKWGYNEVTQNTPVVRVAKKHDVRGKVVFGIIPNYLARYAVSTVELEIVLPKQDKRHKNTLSVDDLHKYTKNVHEYVVVYQANNEE